METLPLEVMMIITENIGFHDIINLKKTNKCIYEKIKTIENEYLVTSLLNKYSLKKFDIKITKYLLKHLAEDHCEYLYNTFKKHMVGHIYKTFSNIDNNLNLKYHVLKNLTWLVDMNNNLLNKLTLDIMFEYISNDFKLKTNNIKTFLFHILLNIHLFKDNENIKTYIKFLDETMFEQIRLSYYTYLISSHLYLDNDITYIISKYVYNLKTGYSLMEYLPLNLGSFKFSKYSLSYDELNIENIVNKKYSNPTNELINHNYHCLKSSLQIEYPPYYNRIVELENILAYNKVFIENKISDKFPNYIKVNSKLYKKYIYEIKKQIKNKKIRECILYDIYSYIKYKQEIIRQKIF